MAREIMPLEMTRADASKEAPKKRQRLAEAAGGTAAGCAAVACCCPCGILGLLLLAVASVPAVIGRRMVRKKRRGKKAAVLMMEAPQKSANSAVAPASMTEAVAAEVGMTLPAKATAAAEVADMEERMWAQFAGAGFWRSPSQRE